MQKEIIFCNKKIEFNESYVRLLLIIFTIAFLAKGSVIFRGFSIDDYYFSSGVSYKSLDLFISQGRYIAALLLWSLDFLGVNINDMYFPLGIMAIFLLCVFVVSIFRFVGVQNSPTAGLIGGIVVAHPYLTEIFTFRMAMPSYCVALIFSIITLEAINRNPKDSYMRGVALIAALGMLFIYQVFLNYFAVAIIFAFIQGLILYNKQDQSFTIYQDRAIVLTSISAIAAIMSILMMKLVRMLKLVHHEHDGRSRIINFDEIPERINQILSALKNIYWSGYGVGFDPIFPDWLKMLIAWLLFFSIGIIFSHFFKSQYQKKIHIIIFILVGFLLLMPTSIGVIISLGDWWPVPRVISHVAIIVGLVFLMADCIQDLEKPILKSTIFTVRLVILCGFVLLSNQILADQQRINQWDQMLANRITSRLESLPEFNRAKFIHIDGGTRNYYPSQLKTSFNDMNITALSPFESNQRIACLLSEVSGYNFELAENLKASIGSRYCATKKPWPHTESIYIKDDLAIVCLKK